MRISLEGLPGAEMWTDETSREDAARAVERTVPADATAAVRIYVIAPPSTPAQDFAFAVTSLEEQGETASSETRFTGPGDQ
jgi:hypothetical protein